uniref:ATP synthase subunit 8 n=1 Tax=Laternula truncata TaxID=1199070 RepID=A0A1U9XPL7_9BIVA|nr:ATP synthase F0 subunit 8 [Laternula truncata]AQZ26195.1 ATP synthase subunit 8 [Laternula truncata]
MPHFGPLNWISIYCGIWGGMFSLMSVIWWWGKLA